VTEGIKPHPTPVIDASVLRKLAHRERRRGGGTAVGCLSGTRGRSVRPRAFLQGTVMTRAAEILEMTDG
jgi:hypothetical protein